MFLLAAMSSVFLLAVFLSVFLSVYESVRKSVFLLGFELVLWSAPRSVV